MQVNDDFVSIEERPFKVRVFKSVKMCFVFGMVCIMGVLMVLPGNKEVENEALRLAKDVYIYNVAFET